MRTLTAPLRPRPASFLMLLASLFLHSAAAGQMFTYERERAPTMTTLGPALHVVEFNGSADNGLLGQTSFSGPAYGIHFTRPGFAAYFAYGTATSGEGDALRDLRLIDASLTVWSGMDLTRDGGTRLILPVVLHSGYRGLDDRGTGAFSGRNFDLTVFALGTGLAVESRAGERIGLEARATPMFGLATRSFEGAAGTTLLADADAQVHLLNLVGDFGISAGYALRVQRWNIDEPGSVLAPRENRDRFTGMQHAVRVSVNW